MGKKKRLAKITAAVQGILGDKVKAKKLKKAKALRGFIDKLEAKQIELQQHQDQKILEGDQAKEVERHLEILEKQIKKAKILLKEMEQ